MAAKYYTKKNWVLNLIIVLIFFVFCAGQVSWVSCWYMARQFLTMVFMVMGVTMEMASGVLDLSVAAEISASTCVGASLMAAGHPTAAVIAGMLLFHLCIGVFKGFLIATLPVDPVVPTLAIQVILPDLAGMIAGTPLVLKGRESMYASSAFWAVVILALLVVTVFLFLLSRYSYYGKYARMMGENPEAVRRSGLNDVAIRMIICGASSFVMGISSAIILMITNVGSPSNGNHYLYPALAAAVLGGANFLNGRGSAAGACAGTASMVLFLYMMIGLGIPQGAEMVLEGVLIILAIVLNLYHTTGGDRKKKPDWKKNRKYSHGI